MKLKEAYDYCHQIARSHYENFPVGLLLPRNLIPHVHAVYAFARHADDFADEGYLQGESMNDNQPLSPQERLAALEKWEEGLHEKHPQHPVFIALRHTIEKFSLPLSLFTDLLCAFKQDVTQVRYENFDEILDYCRRSANPIGRLVLLLHGHNSPSWMKASDAICTALQITNFWQDVSRDLLKNRIYLPQSEMKTFGVSEKDLFEHRVTEGYRHLLAFQVERGFYWFRKGEALPFALPFPLSLEIKLTWHGGVTILNKIKKQNYDTLTSRPKITRWDTPSLLLKSLLPYPAL